MAIKEKVVATLSNLKFKAVAHKPEITLAIGLAATVGAVVTAAVAATKSSNTINEAKMDIEDIDSDGVTEFLEYQNARREQMGLEPVDITNADPEVEKKKIKRKCTKSVVKYWILPSGLLIVSGICQISTYRTLNSRLITASMAAIAAEAGRREIESAFAKYRGNVAEKFGEEVEEGLFEEIMPKKTVTVQETDPETGEVIEREKEVIDDSKLPIYSIYSKVYTNRSYQPGLDVETVRNVQNWANDRLITRGYVFLNEVYEALGFEPDGDFVGIGWKSREFTKDKSEDGYIDFHLFGNDLSRFNKDVIRWRNADPSITNVRLDFNVDGPIYKDVNAINAAMRGEKNTWMVDRAAFYRSRPQAYHV